MKRILDVYFCWRDLSIDDVVKVSSLHIERVRVLLQLHCNLIAVCSVHLPPSFTVLFVLVQRLAFSLSSTKWLRLALHRRPKLRLAPHLWRCPSTLLHPSLTLCMFVRRIGRLALPSRRLCVDIYVHPSLYRSLPPLAGSQCSSDTRSCSGRSSCARPQRIRHHRLEADLLE